MPGRVALAVICAIGLGAEAGAASLTEETLRNDHVVLHLTGRIDSKDAALFAAAVDKLTAAGKRIDVVQPQFHPRTTSGGGADCVGHQGVAAGDARRGRRCVRGGLLPGVCGRRTPNRASKCLHSTRRPTMTAARPTSRARQPARWWNLRANSGFPRPSPTRSPKAVG